MSRGGRELGLFSCSISPGFALSHNMQMVNATSNWLCFGAFLSPPAPPCALHRPLATDYCSPATRHSPLAGYSHPPTADVIKTERGPISMIGMVQAEVTAPGRQDRGWVAILDQ